MKRLYVDNVGEVTYWNDFIQSKYYKKDGESYTEYKQSNTKLDGYCYRTIGISRKTNGYVIAVALSKDELTPKTEKSGKGVVIHRIKSLINKGLSTTIDDKGITWVPVNYLDLLYNDPATYNNIFGPIDPMAMKIAIAKLDESEVKATDFFYKEKTKKPVD